MGKNIFIIAVPAFLSLPCAAQTVAIPDPQFQAKLNAWVPGLVTGGNMPVNNDALIPSTFDLVVDWSPADLTGLDYLQGLGSLTVECESDPIFSTLPVLPPTLNVLTTHGFPAAATWPVLPTNCRSLHVFDSDIATLPSVAGGFGELELHNTPNVTVLPNLSNTWVDALKLYNTGITVVNESIDTYWQVILDSNTVLTSVTLEGTTATFDNGVEIQNCPLLSSVTIHHTASIRLEELPALTSIGTLNNDLDWLRIIDCTQLAVLPTLPNPLYELEVNGTSVPALPSLPTQLVELIVRLSPVTTLPALPASLTHLVVMSCPLITSLPSLPSGLFELTLKAVPSITAMPVLNNGLQVLWLEDIDFEVSVMPNSIGGLILYDIPNTTLPALPNSLIDLDLRYSPVTSFTSLPASLQSMVLEDLPMKCLPWLPAGFLGMQLWNTPITCLRNHPVNMSTMLPICGILNSTCREVLPFVTGTVYWDRNQNGLHDIDEAGLPDVRVACAPFGYMTETDSTGYYQLAIPMGQDTIEIAHSVYGTNAEPAEVPLDITTPDSLITGIDFGVQVDSVAPDLAVTNWWSEMPISGFQRAHKIVVENTGTTQQEVEVRLSVDPLVDLVSTSMPAVADGSDLVWEFDSLRMGEHRSITCHFQVQLGTLGLPVTMVSRIDPFAADTDTLNNVHADSVVVLGSYDPNDKRVAPPSLSVEQGALGRRVEYTVRFQNTGTAAAERVLIIDTLDSGLVPESFELLGSSHPCSWFYRNNALHFLFDPIYLPDSTSDEPGSHGAVLFAINTRFGLTPGTSVPNVADIYFDFNAPVITDPCLLEVELPQAAADLSNADVEVYPIPSAGLLQLRQSGQWTGARYRVLNTAGIVVAEGYISTDAMAIDLRALAQGIYVLRLEGRDHTWSRRVIKE